MSLAAWCLASFTAVSFAAEADDHFFDRVQPLLAGKCVSCHGPDKQEGGLRLDSLDAARKGGDRGPALVPGDLEKSWLVRSIRFDDPDLQMPPKNKLAANEIAALERWVREGATWPAPVVVLFEDEPSFLASLTSGNGRGRLTDERPHSGKSALSMTPLQRDGVKIPGWNFAIREKPGSGEYRYLRLAWKKRGEGSVMLELASSGHWPDAKVAKGRYVAGPNTTGWAAISVAERAPSDWTVVTFDLWRDIGEFTLTGCAPTCDRGDEALFDMLILGPSLESLDAYKPGRPVTPIANGMPNAVAASGSPSATPSAAAPPVGDAFTDANNPIRKLFHGERLDLWSLKKPVRVELRDDKRHPIDQFVASHAEADRRTLIRRLTYDLHGLPPTPAEIDAFQNNRAPNAYAQLVDRLLDSPRYGERQAQLWLDVVRYADTNGYERDEFRPLAWQYRDYVIRAFNADKPYDRFVLEQLAGDELLAGPPRSADEADALIATGYLRLGQWDSTAAIFQEEPRLRAEMMADLTNTTASAFLGLTYSCCQCHDHKYDPLSQADHYRLRSFFTGLKSRDDMVVELADELAKIQQHNSELDRKIVPLKAELDKLKKDDEKTKARREELGRQISEFESKKRQSRVAWAASDDGAAVPTTHVFYQGDFHSPRAEVGPGYPSVLFPNSVSLAPPRSDTSGRRTALARWIVAPENPWTARVIVNRIWQQHFGVGLVATPNDFGYSGARPSHPELLDWLATELVRESWSIKKLHRLIVTSAAYRQSSRATKDDRGAVGARPQVRRLDAEQLRDSLLAVSGLLKPHEAGRPLWPAVPDELLKAQPAILEAEKGGDGGRMQGWYTDPLEATDVRSVFLVRKRAVAVPFLQTFDLPDTTVSCARRDSTVVAPQALLLLNSPESVRFAEALADRVTRLAGPDADIRRRIDTAFRETLGRLPDDEERRLAEDLLARHGKVHAKALVDLCRALLNTNEFVYID